MKKSIHIFLITALLAAAGTVMAQPDGPPPGGEKREQIEAMKVAFLTRKLDLTPDEAKVFWPVYNQYQDELYALRENRRKQAKPLRDDLSSVTDKEAEKMVEDEIMFRQQELDLLKKYHVQLKQVLPIKKVALLYRAEDDFKRDLLKKIQERREGGGHGPRRRF